ncbi:tryptophan 7-halogenase [Stenoxybacter acetivorans]|uniref:tryptophan 7-halogenase n=1 Tax=Stenoxybacter acetivorans TaxID=422441 RepID=UPI0005681D8C|nr:tryptophan 7-halogenase [Stenoxybacter acetivorans]
MKRHPDLAHFSREHHTALSLCNCIRREPNADHTTQIEAVRDAILAHFDAEERQFSAYWHKLNQVHLQEQFLQEHQELRQCFRQPENAAVLAEKLTAHVRFEERVLFPAFEQNGLI